MFYIILSIILFSLPLYLNKQKLQVVTDQYDTEAQSGFNWDQSYNKFIRLASVILFTVGIFGKLFFYAEPGYTYHVRTIFGQERAIMELGYSFYGSGKYVSWKMV